MGNELKAIETSYAGSRFRSRLEARWAVFFDTLGVGWEYEPQGFDMGGECYLPDFWLSDIGVWWEVKGEHTQTACDKTIRLVHMSEKPGVVSFGQPHERATWGFTRRYPRVYLAGKMTPWRDTVVPLFEGAGVTVVGPDHKGATHNIWLDDTEQIDDCDLVFAWIDALDCYGTICEIGYASRARAHIWVEFASNIDSSNFWLIEQAACDGSDHQHSTPEEAMGEWLAEPPWNRGSGPTVWGEAGVRWGSNARGAVSLFIETDREHRGHWFPDRSRPSPALLPEDLLRSAEDKARSARFEYGEKG